MRCIDMVTRTADSSNTAMLWDNFSIFQSHNGRQPILTIGERSESPQAEDCQSPNPMKRGLRFHQLLKDGTVGTKAELARHLGLTRLRVSIVMNLLNLDEEIKDYLLELDDSDPKLKPLNG